MTINNNNQIPLADTITQDKVQTSISDNHANTKPSYSKPTGHDDEVSNVDLALGQKLRLFRVQFGKTQSDVADFLQISPQQYQKYEKGASRCSISSIYRLAEFYDKSVSELLPPIGQNAPGFHEEGASFNSPTKSTAITDEADAMAQLLAVFVRISSKPMRKKMLSLLNEMF